MNSLDRYRGCLLGLAVGDALGAAVEFNSPGTFAPVSDLTGGGPFGLARGQWTDDTSMALCLAESLLARGGVDVGDQLQRYIRWRDEGHLSSNGRCFDIGHTVRTALQRYELTGAAPAGIDRPDAAGNGSIMRNAPVALFFARRPDEARAAAALTCRATHGAREAVEACELLTVLTLAALNGVAKSQLFAGALPLAAGFSPLIRTVAAGSFAQKQPPAIRGTGYVVDSLEAALWAFHHSETFESGALLAVNLGDDADTTAAVYGQLAGAFYGVNGIPKRWLEVLAHRDLIDAFAVGLFSASFSPALVSAADVTANPAAVVAAARTTFTYRTREQIHTIRLGQGHPQLDRLVAADGLDAWAYLTAWMPRAVGLSPVRNSARQTRLVAALRKAGLKVIPGRPVPDTGGWFPHESVLAPGLDEAGAARLGREFGQSTVVVGRIAEPARLVWCEREPPGPKPPEPKPRRGPSRR